MKGQLKNGHFLKINIVYQFLFIRDIFLAVSGSDADFVTLF